MDIISESNHENPSFSSTVQAITNYVIYKADVKRISIRKIAEITGINHSRCGRILHRDPTRRHSIKIYELMQVLDVLNIELMEAALANDTLIHGTIIPDASVERAAILTLEFVRGLPLTIIGIVRDLQGLDCSDIRKEQGSYLRSLIVEIINREYSEIANRRDGRSNLQCALHAELIRSGME